MPIINTAVNPANTTGRTTGPAGSGSSTPAALEGLGSDAFMKLLVAQMRYQNPMAPTDGTQYMQQISQYAMVEQMQKVTEGQQQASSYQRALIASSMIGKVVAGTSDAGRPVSGEVLGVTFPAGRAVLVTTGGDLPVDRLDEARLPTTPAGTTPAGTTPAGTKPSTPAPTNQSFNLAAL